MFHYGQTNNLSGRSARVKVQYKVNSGSWTDTALGTGLAPKDTTAGGDSGPNTTAVYIQLTALLYIPASAYSSGDTITVRPMGRPLHSHSAYATWYYNRAYDQTNSDYGSNPISSIYLQEIEPTSGSTLSIG